MKLISHTGRGPRAKISVTTQNLGPSGISVSMDAVADTLRLGPCISCFQDILIHGQNTRVIRRAIERISPHYQIYLDTDSFAPDDHRKTNYGGWRVSGMACLTLIHKRVFDTPKCAKYEWRSPKDRRANLGNGRVLWIKARTTAGKAINIVNVYQATSDKPNIQKKTYEALLQALRRETDPCILLGDFNAIITGGRWG